jgi:dienelactone hydrolase
VIGVIVSGFACSKHGRPAFASAFLLPDMMLELPVRPVTWFTDEPVVERTYIEYGSDRILADIYRPDDGEQHAAIIFSMGAPPLDLDDSRLRKLAEDAARGGLVMIVPFSERLDAQLIVPEEIDALVGIFQYAQRQPYIDAERVGYIGVSVGGSLALVAAEDPRIADDVDFAVSFGGYYNTLDTFASIASRDIEYEGQQEEWEPDEHTVEVTALQVLIELPDARDRSILCKAFVDEWDWALCDATFDDLDPFEPSDVDRMTPTGRTAYEFMTAPDFETASALLQELPAAIEEKLVALSPDEGIERLRAELYVIHDRGDKFIPYVESRRLRDALAAHSDAKVHYTEVSLFEHVEPRLGRGGAVIVIDSAQLYFRLYQLLLKLT